MPREKNNYAAIFAAFLQKTMKEQNVTQSELGRRAKLSQAVISEFLLGGHMPRLSSIARLAAALNIAVRLEFTEGKMVITSRTRCQASGVEQRQRNTASRRKLPSGG